MKTMEERLLEENEAIRAENATLSAQLKASIESSSILEECLVEMAGIVYA